MKHSQVILGKTLKTFKCTWTFISPACTRLHLDTLCSHARTWFTESSLTMTPRQWPWAVSMGRSLQPFRHEITMRCIRWLSPWLSWLLFILPNNKGHSRDILKDWVKDPTHFRMTPNQIYKTKILRKEYQCLFIFSCRLSGQLSGHAGPIG